VRRPPAIWTIDPLEDCLANALLETGRLDEAIIEYQRILQLNENYPLAYYHLAQAHERKGQQNGARAAYEPVTRPMVNDRRAPYQFPLRRATDLT